MSSAMIYIVFDARIVIISCFEGEFSSKKQWSLATQFCLIVSSIEKVLSNCDHVLTIVVHLSRERRSTKMFFLIDIHSKMIVTSCLARSMQISRREVMIVSWIERFLRSKTTTKLSSWIIKCFSTIKFNHFLMTNKIDVISLTLICLWHKRVENRWLNIKSSMRASIELSNICFSIS